MGGGGGWGAEGGAKHPFRLKGQCSAFSKCHELIQSTREAQTAVRSSLVPHAVLLTHPRTMKCTLVVSQHRQKAVCKSRPGNLLSSAWCFWIVHECAYRVQAKDGFQLLCLNGRFSKIRSHTYRESVPIQWFLISFLLRCKARRLMIFSAFNHHRISMTEWPFEYRATYVQLFAYSFITELGCL